MQDKNNILFTTPLANNQLKKFAASLKESRIDHSKENGPASKKSR